MDARLSPLERLPASQRAVRRRIIALLDLTDLRPEVNRDAETVMRVRK